MPLLKKRVFEKASPQEFLRDDEEVFFCEVTNEIFRNYEEFAERMLLCTSMVWTCALTGKSNLTYEEALESEENARRSISEFPVELRIPVLYIANKTKRTAFGEMAEDVFLYCKDRYFIGEKVESCFTANKWVESHVLQVVAPSQDQIKKLSSNGSTDKTPVPPPSLFKYEIEHLDADDADISEIMIVDHNQIRRKKALFSREKCKLFLKQYVQQDTNGHWIIKPSAIKELHIDQMKFDQIFGGPDPAFDSSKKYDRKSDTTVTVNGKKSRQETLSKYLTKLNGPTKMNGTVKSKENEASSAKKTKEDEAKGAQLLEEMEKRFEEHQKMKLEREKDQKLVIAQLRKWKQPREDLVLEDQQPLPDFPALITSKLPEKYVGDVIMIMEFIKRFESSFSPKKFIQGKITLDLMERALLEKEVAGPLIDIIQMFLSAIMREQEEEKKDYSLIPAKATFLKDIDVNNMSLEESMKFATLSAHWPKKVQGLHLRELPLYSLTVSEVLRLHLLSSGTRIQESSEKKRYYLRGGYTTSDDPGLHLRHKKPHIVKALAIKNVTQLRIKDKIEILSCLMYQLLTYPNYRDAAEDKRERNLQLKMKVKTLEREHKKRENEFNSTMYHLKKKGKQDQNIEKEVADLTKADEKRKLEIDDDLEDHRIQFFEEELFLGLDRAYRKYYKLDSLNGLFIDTTEDNPGKCLSSIVKQHPELVKGNTTAIRKYLEKNINLFKENGVQEDLVAHPPMTNGVKEDPEKESPSAKTNGTVENGHSDLEDPLHALLMCSSNEKTCVVHSDKREQGKWRLVPNVEMLDQLLATLNKRGYREVELIQLIRSMERRKMENFLEGTPMKLWSTEEEAEPQNGHKKKHYVEANFGFPAGTSIDDILQNTLTDEILELDEKICNGSLGQFRGKNREEWRNALFNKDYKRFDREINRRVLDEREETVVKEEEDEVVAEVHRKFAKQDPGTFLGPSNPCDSDSDSEDADLVQSSDCKQAVQCLAIALAQVAHSVEPRFLHKPLGVSDGRKLATFVPSINQLMRWEESLLLSTSFSQIFLHYSTLDASIMWSRSTHQAGCKVCRKKADSENMLLCDNCNRGFHLYCLKPKLEGVPNGEWFCETCETARNRSQRLVASEWLPKKKRRVFEEEGEDIVPEELPDIDIKPKYRVIEVEVCCTCNSGGRLMTCRNCELSYHKECVNPPLTRAKVDWVCDKCRDDITKDKEETKTPNNNDKSNSSRRSRRSEKDNKKREEPEDNSSDSDNYPLVRAHPVVGIINNERRSAAKARHTISNFVKSLRRFSPPQIDSDSGDSSKPLSKRKRSFRKECGRDDLPLHNAALQDLLQETMKHPEVWPFLRPVKNTEVPDYHELISHPMDFGTIKYKLNMGEYQTDSQVLNDCALVFQNCNTYNEANSEIHRCGMKVLKSFKSKCEELGLEVPSKLAEVADKKKRRKLY